MLKSNIARVSAGAVLAGLSAASVNGAVIMNQIGGTPSAFTGQNGYLSMRFTDIDQASSSALVDDFVTPSASTLTSVQAAVLGFGTTFKSLSNITGWEVAIYSSLSAANTSLTGNIYDAVFSPAAVSLTAPYSGDAKRGLVTIPTNISLSSGGTYFVAVMALNAFQTNGEVSVYAPGFLANIPGANPGGDNAIDETPGASGGFLSPTSTPTSANAAYEISTAVPEPTAGLMLLSSTAVVALSRRRRTTTESGIA